MQAVATNRDKIEETMQDDTWSRNWQVAHEKKERAKMASEHVHEWVYVADESAPVQPGKYIALNMKLHRFCTECDVRQELLSQTVLDEQEHKIRQLEQQLATMQQTLAGAHEILTATAAVLEARCDRLNAFHLRSFVRHTAYLLRKGDNDGE